MEIFKIEIKELLCDIVEVEAHSEKEAIEKVKKLYKNADIVLDWSNHIDTEILVYNNKYLRFDRKKLVNEVIDYLFKDEQKHFEESEEKPDDHIYHKLLRLKELNNFFPD